MIYPCTAIDDDCTCSPVYPESIESGQPNKQAVPSISGGLLPITGSVGAGGQNLPNDVSTIQDGLNRVPVDQGRASPPLVVDGKCGPMTKGAIQKFQLKHFGWNGADSRVDVGKQTHQRLSELLNQGPQISISQDSWSMGSSSGDVMPSQLLPVHLIVAGYLPTVRAAIAAARLRASQALMVTILPELPVNGLPIMNAGSPLPLVDRHFSILKLDRVAQRNMARRILTIFERMDSVFSKPGGLWGVKAFIPEPGDDLEKKRMASAFLGGFTMSGEIIVDPIADNGVLFARKDAITINAVRWEKLKPAQAMGMHILIHELAHFVGEKPDQPSLCITDIVYGAPEDSMLQNLTPAQKLQNADCYAGFARESLFGVHGRPDWMKPQRKGASFGSM